MVAAQANLQPPRSLCFNFVVLGRANDMTTYATYMTQQHYETFPLPLQRLIHGTQWRMEDSTAWQQGNATGRYTLKIDSQTWMILQKKDICVCF